ncbi:MAG: molybdopterin molybdotransferase MoeA [Deltaproteobacteria bacterium]
MKRISEALEVMMPAFRTLGEERVTLHDLLGRVVARDVLARADLPPFDNSAMDGYAVRAADATAGASLTLAGESRAGGPTPPALEAGTAMRIFTGAVVPPGADAVVMQENTTAGDGAVTIDQAPVARENIRHRGSDLESGAVMLPKGMRVGPGEIGLLAAQRIGAVGVNRRPVVAILSTGDELRDVTDPEEPGTIVNSNAYALAAQVREAGGIPWVIPNVPDDMDATVASVREGLGADLLLTCGGVSVGDYDLVKDAFEKNGIDASFWKVRIKPGKPLTFGLAGDKPVVGLPGNPVSAMVTFEVFVRPGIRRMLGDPTPFRVRHTVELAVDHKHSPRRPELARCTLERDGGVVRARPLRLQGSGSLPSMLGVDALVMLPADQSTFAAGEKLDAILLADHAGAAEAPFDA